MMPAKSKAQFKKMFVLAKQGKISKGELDKFTHNVNYKSLPSSDNKNPRVNNSSTTRKRKLR